MTDRLDVQKIKNEKKPGLLIKIHVFRCSFPVVHLRFLPCRVFKTDDYIMLRACGFHTSNDGAGFWKVQKISLEMSRTALPNDYAVAHGTLEKGSIESPSETDWEYK